MITKEAIEAAAKELLAHGEFGTSDGASRRNAVVAAEAALTAAFAAMPEPSVKVKPLEWKDAPVPPSGECLASSVVGLYCIPHGSGIFHLRFRDSIALGDFSTLDAAKAAAQADYEARIAELEKDKHAALTMIVMLEKQLAEKE